MNVALQVRSAFDEGASIGAVTHVHPRSSADEPSARPRDAVASLTALAFDPVLPGKAIELPADAGAHPGHRIEWWYVTGQLDSPRGPLGFQVTFFRVRNPDAEGGPAASRPRSCCSRTPRSPSPRTDRCATTSAARASASGSSRRAVGDTRRVLDDWSLRARGRGVSRAHAPPTDSRSTSCCAPRSRRCCRASAASAARVRSRAHASYYYSEPHLEVTGDVSAQAARRSRCAARRGSTTSGRASCWPRTPRAGTGSAPTSTTARALMAFRIRAHDGNTLWAGGARCGRRAASRSRSRPDRCASSRGARGNRRAPAPTYPVAMDVHVGGDRTWRLEPLMDDQELDARASTGTLYWEGAVRVRVGPARRARLPRAHRLPREGPVLTPLSSAR